MASEDEDKELELKDLIIQTLEANGVLPKLKAQIRASVFTALDESDKKTQTVIENPFVKKLLSSREGRLTISLVKEFLELCNLEYTLAVFDPEINAHANIEERSKLAKAFDIYENDETKSFPILTQIVKECLSNQVTRSKKFEGSETLPKDKNGIIDKNELRDLFVDIYPNFNKNMIERYVNDEFNASDRDFSSGIDFDEFKSIYKRLFLLCRSVVLHDVNDVLSDRSGQTINDTKSNNKEDCNEIKIYPQNTTEVNNFDDTTDEESYLSRSEKTESHTSIRQIKNQADNNRVKTNNKSDGSNNNSTSSNKNNTNNKNQTNNKNLIDLDDLSTTSSSSSSSSTIEKFQPKDDLNKKVDSSKISGANQVDNKKKTIIDDDDEFVSIAKKAGITLETHRSNSSVSSVHAPNPNTNKIDAKTSLKDAPNLFTKPAANASNLKDIEKKIKGLGIADYDDDNYDDDFTSGTTPRTMSHSGPADKRRIKARNLAASDEEIDENISYAEESSKFDEVTVDKSISTIQGNNEADYLEDL